MTIHTSSRFCKGPSLRYDGYGGKLQKLRPRKRLKPAYQIRMNGQLSDHPLAELIREIAAKSLSGRLRLQQDLVKIAIYFEYGSLLYAAANAKPLRLREHLLKSNLLTALQLQRFNERISDLELARTLSVQGLITAETVDQVQVKQVYDILRTGLLWVDGTWEFDNRSHLNDVVNFDIDTGSLLLETGRRVPEDFISSRFRNPHEIFAPGTTFTDNNLNLLPTEVFVFSRVDQPTSLTDIVSVSGMGETEALKILYSLSLSGVLHRESWKNAFRDQQGAVRDQQPPKPVRKPIQATPPPPIVVPAVDDAETYLNRLESASSHYEVLGVAKEASRSEIKEAYYGLARNYHPDRFRQAAGDIQSRIETVFARVTHAYDTLRDAGQRATYDSKLKNQAKIEQLAETAPTSGRKHVTTSSGDGDKFEDPLVAMTDLAEQQFKEGFAALSSGQRSLAMSLLANAARAVPVEPRYRAYYGKALAAHEGTRRLAETELQAAVRLDPGNSEYRLMLAELYRDLGFAVRARGEAERAVSLDPNNRKARDLLRTLQ